MLKICNFSLVGLLLLSSIVSSAHETTINVGLSSSTIGLNVREYPRFQIIPGYPVYYSPYMQSNYFFYDGMYWVYEGNNWYESSWYDGPWWQVHPDEVPLFILRVPVRYYRVPPPYFIGWQYDAPPRWGAHWGNKWSQHRKGWDKWDHHRVPAPTPLPTYQQNYSGDRYPKQIERQRELSQENYEFQSNDQRMPQQNENIKNRRLQNQYHNQNDRRQNRLEEQYHEQRQGIKQKRDDDIRLGDQSLPYRLEKDQADNRGQQTENNGETVINRETGILKTIPKNSQPRDYDYKAPNQRQDQNNKQEQKQNYKSNPNRQFRDVY